MAASHSPEPLEVERNMYWSVNSSLLEHVHHLAVQLGVLLVAMPERGPGQFFQHVVFDLDRPGDE